VSDDLYPEHSKLTKVRDQSQACGELIEWLHGQGVHFMRWETWTEKDLCSNLGCRDGRVYSPADHEHRTCPVCDGDGLMDREHEGWIPEQRSITTLLAEFFGIDQDKLEQEKRAMLDALRALQESS
jgi:hypothetical protein